LRLAPLVGGGGHSTARPPPCAPLFSLSMSAHGRSRFLSSPLLSLSAPPHYFVAAAPAMRCTWASGPAARELRATKPMKPSQEAECGRRRLPLARLLRAEEGRWCVVGGAAANPNPLDVALAFALQRPGTPRRTHTSHSLPFAAGAGAEGRGPASSHLLARARAFSTRARAAAPARRAARDSKHTGDQSIFCASAARGVPAASQRQR